MMQLKDDAELKPVFDDIEAHGAAAMEKYWNDTELMSRISQKLAAMNIGPATPPRPQDLPKYKVGVPAAVRHGSTRGMLIAVPRAAGLALHAARCGQGGRRGSATAPAGGAGVRRERKGRARHHRAGRRGGLQPPGLRARAAGRRRRCQPRRQPRQHRAALCCRCVLQACWQVCQDRHDATTCPCMQATAGRRRRSCCWARARRPMCRMWMGRRPAAWRS